MAHHNKEKPFLNATARSDFGHYLIQKACFFFLAATTAVMVYGAFAPMLTELLPPALVWSGILAIVIVLYLIIDHRLDGDFFDHWRTKAQLKDRKMETESYRHARSYQRRRGAMLWFRFLLTITSSIWAGGEIAEFATTPPDHAAHAERIVGHEQQNDARLAAASAAVSAARSEQEVLVAEAEARGADLVRRAIAGGNRHQRAKYKQEPGFFYPPPRNQYYATNLAYGRRIAKAKEEADRLVEAAQAPLATAMANRQALQANVFQDTTTTLLGSLAQAQEASYQSTVARRTTFVRGLDIVAAILGLLILRVRFLRQRAAGWAPSPTRRNVASLFAQARDNIGKKLLASLEEALDLDLDGDGHVGAPPSPTPSTGPAGGTGAQLKWPSYGHPPPSPTPPSAAPGQPIRPVATTGSVVATTPNALSTTGTVEHSEETVMTPPVSAEQLLGAYRSTMAYLNALDSRKETPTVTTRKKEFEAKLDGILNELHATGWSIDKREGRTGAYFLYPI